MRVLLGTVLPTFGVGRGLDRKAATIDTAARAVVGADDDLA
jgi:hypothetical protein